MMMMMMMMYAPAHGMRDTVQQLLHKTLNCIFLSYDYNRPELTSINYKI